MLYDQREQIGKLTRCTEEYLTLAVLHIFLDVESDGFRRTEIFHGFRYSNSHLCAKTKEVVNCMARSKYNGGMIQNRNFLLSKFLCRQTLNFYKRAEIYFHAVLLSNVEIRRLL